MSRWQHIRKLASLIEAESEGRLIDRDQAITLARLLAQDHPHIGASLNMIVERMKTSPQDRVTPPASM
ncbi:MAG: hypothetical protein H7Z12_16265 [Rhodospirillaceae bacterium]|nr:hypothetical protein [Rhodospirillales bacterium]